MGGCGMMSLKGVSACDARCVVVTAWAMIIIWISRPRGVKIEVGLPVAQWRCFHACAQHNCNQERRK